MRLVDAVYERIEEYLKERGTNLNALAVKSGVPRATLATMTRSTTVKLSTIYGVCEGLGITIKDFFDSPLFDRENLED